MFLGGSPDESGQSLRHLSRSLVSPFLGQPGVPGDVEEAHRRGTMQPVKPADPFQRTLDDLLEGTLPGVFLLSAICGEEGLFHEGGQPGPELGDRKSTRLNSSHMSISYAV